MASSGRHAGRCPQARTWYRSDGDLPPNLLNYDIISSDHAHLYYHGTPLYPFGYGLSYTAFRYSNLRTSASSVGSSGTVNVTIQIRLDSPTGPLAGTATVANTGSDYTYTATSASLTGARGRHDVYLVFGSSLRLATFSIT